MVHKVITPEREPVPITGIMRWNSMAQTLYICNDTLTDLSRIYQSVWIAAGNSSWKPRTGIKKKKKIISAYECQRVGGCCVFTSGSLWKMTTRPPLSPVARSSPVWLNSTVEIISAEGEREQRDKDGGRQRKTEGGDEKERWKQRERIELLANWPHQSST